MAAERRLSAASAAGPALASSCAAAAVIDYIRHDSSDEKVKDLFDFYDADGNGMIQRDELLNVLALCAHEIGLEVDAYLEQIVEAVFGGARLTKCGSITYEGLKEVLRLRPNLTDELSLADGHGDSSKTTAASGGRPNRAGQCRPCQGVANYLACRWDLVAERLSRRLPVCSKLRVDYISNNLARFNFFVALLAVSGGLYGARVVSYWNHCGFLIAARASGQCLNFLCSIIVLLVCRRSISLLRSRGWGRYLPLDDHVYFHKLIGLLLAGHSALHTLGHLLNFMVEAGRPEAAFSWSQYVFSTQPGLGWLGGCASLTGWLLLLIVLVMSLGQPCARSLGKFELFYYTHLLYIPFWALLFVHAPRFWCWFLGPFLVFALESLIRLRKLLNSFTTHGHTTIIKATPLPSNVIHLVIKRPPHFEYNPGDWIYVLVPQIAKYEWHPFTISSAPEQEGVIWLHIRAVGEWTRSLRAFFEGQRDRNYLRSFIKSGQFSISMDTFGVAGGAPELAGSPGTGSSVRDKISHLRQATNALAPIPENKSLDSALTEMSVVAGSPSTTLDISDSSQLSSASCGAPGSSRNSSIQRSLPNITVYIDGPYGSPSSQIFRAEHAVLIATGIGVTPFASILQSIVHHYEKRRQKCPNCSHDFLDKRAPFVCKLKKVDFVWINRDQKSFEWFIKLLAELELTQSHLPTEERFLDIHIHLTAIEPAKTKSIGLQLALYLVHEKNKKDLVTGLRTRTKAGRPNWDEFFHQIQAQKKGKVSVFFCGRPQLAQMLHRHCDSFGFKFRKEIF